MHWLDHGGEGRVDAVGAVFVDGGDLETVGLTGFQVLIGIERSDTPRVLHRIDALVICAPLDRLHIITHCFDASVREA